MLYTKTEQKCTPRLHRKNTHVPSKISSLLKPFLGRKFHKALCKKVSFLMAAIGGAKRKGRYLTSVVSQWHLSSLSSSIYFFAPILCYLLLCFSKLIIALSRHKKRATFRSLSFIKCFFRQGKNLALCN